MQQADFSKWCGDGRPIARTDLSGNPQPESELFGQKEKKNVWLFKLLTPTEDTIFDPFCGTKRTFWQIGPRSLENWGDSSCIMLNFALSNKADLTDPDIL